MSIQKTTIYRTRDGQNFDDIHSAEIHELGLDLMGVCIKQGFHNEGSVKMICASIAKNFDKYEEILAKLKSKNLAKRKKNSLTNPQS